jgi:rhomboid-like protein
MATIALYSCAFPRNTFLIFFVIPCPAWAFLPGVLIYDGWRSFSDQVRLLTTCLWNTHFA